jgi:PAS domain-containing protein
MIDAALAGEQQFFVTDYDHPTRGKVAVQTSYLPLADGHGGVGGVVCLLTDITEQRVAERALKESEARFRRIANSAPALMWVTRIDRVTDFKRNGLQMSEPMRPLCFGDRPSAFA